MVAIVVTMMVGMVKVVEVLTGFKDARYDGGGIDMMEVVILGWWKRVVLDVAKVVAMIILIKVAIVLIIVVVIVGW